MDDPRKIRVGKIEDARGVVERRRSVWLVDPRNEPVSSEQNELINPPGTRPYAPLDNYSRKCAHTCTRQVSIPISSPATWPTGIVNKGIDKTDCRPCEFFSEEKKHYEIRKFNNRFNNWIYAVVKLPWLEF